MERTLATAASAPEVVTLDPRRLARLRRIGWLQDSCIPIPGTRYTLGIDQIVGLVPGIGDLIAGIFSLYIILEAARIGVMPKRTRVPARSVGVAMVSTWAMRTSAGRSIGSMLSLLFW